MIEELIIIAKTFGLIFFVGWIVFGELIEDYKFSAAIMSILFVTIMVIFVAGQIIEKYC